MKKLYKSEKDVLVWGILGGIGEYFELDPTVLRLGFIVLVLLTGIFPGIIAYIIAYFIIPERPKNGDVSKTEKPVAPAPKTTPASRLNELSNNVAHTTPMVIQKKEPELDALNIKMEEKDRYVAGERTAPEVASELAVPPEVEGELKKPNWPIITKDTIEYPEEEPTTASLESLLEDEHELGLDDIMDAE